MSTTDIHQVLRDYTERGSEPAFAELVARYIDLVYSVAVRRLDGDAHSAQDVAQTVFTDLARQARSLPDGVRLGGWLHRHTCFVAGNLLRGERRRQIREQHAVEMNALHELSANDWQQLAPSLDEAIDQLEPADRDAILLRYFEERDLRSVGASLGTTEDAAQKRVGRALDKLRALLVARGVTLSVAVLGGALASQAIGAAPAGLATRVSRRAVAATTSAGLLAVLLKWLAPGAAKFALGGAAIVAFVGVLVWSQRDEANQPTASAGARNLAAGPTQLATALLVEPAFQPAAAAAPIADDLNTNVLRLTIVSGDSGRPIPDVPIDFRGWEGDQFAKKELHTLRNGICDVPLNRELVTSLELITRLEGFADTRLMWEPKRGDQIPARYTLRLTRPVRIGGRVVDANGNGVAGAIIGFNIQEDPVAQTASPESHEFQYLELTTDEDGRWTASRVAPDVLHRIYGYARHPEHLASVMAHATRDSELEGKLRAATHVFRLGRATSLRGIVVEADGRAIAEAKVFVGALGSIDRKDTVAAADGTFSVIGCKPGKNLVTAEAPGFAPTTIETEVTTNSEPIRLVLQAGQTLRLRVVNPSGQPIAGARVWLNTYGGGGKYRDKTGAPLIQTEFQPKTDAQGRVQWDEAPDIELVFDCYAPGHMRVNGIRVRPDGQEHLITLTPGLTISGTVRDADSGQPLPQFRIICGWPTPNFGDGTTNGIWSSIERHWMRFSGGAFRHTFDEPIITGTENPGYLFKFEAEGYAPFVSRVVRADETEARLDVTLRTSAATKVSVFLPDGRPADGADVGLVAPGAGLQLRPGGFKRETMGNGAALRRTDARGRVQISSDPAVTRVIFAHPDGYLETTPAALAAEPVVRLQLWGRVEGTYTSGGQPAPGRTVRLQLPGGDWNGASADFEAYRAETDAQGRFTFPKAPPGRHSLVRLVIQKQEGNTTSWRHVPLAEIEISPGETKTINVGGSGYAVTARVRWPDGFKRRPETRVFASIHTPSPHPPAEAVGNPDALSQWRQSAEFRAFAASARHYPLSESADGTWRVEDVIAGNYTVQVFVMPPATTSGVSIPSFTAGVPLTIPSEPAAGTIDLGELVLRVQNPAPQP